MYTNKGDQDLLRLVKKLTVKCLYTVCDWIWKNDPNCTLEIWRLNDFKEFKSP